MSEENLLKSEDGNVLFLILIAVALFAALSYAVTQSTRSGAGSTERESSSLNSATITQHPTALRTAVIRMVLGGNGAEDIGFEPPSTAGFNTDGSSSFRVFHPAGGGAVHQFAPEDAVIRNSGGRWYINYNFEVPQIGREGAAGNDLIAFLPNVTQSICSRINEEFLGDPAIPALDLDNSLINDDYEVGDTFPVGDEPDLSPAGNEFDGQPTGCFQDANYNGAGDAGFIVYSVILER